MFGKMMNNFYYGKSGKGDFRKEDLPKNRLQLFFAMLKVRFTGLMTLNLMSVALYIPLALVIGYAVLSVITSLSVKATCDELLMAAGFDFSQAMDAATLEAARETLLSAGKTASEASIALDFTSAVQSVIMVTLLLLIPCVGITGPVQVGMAYVTRNWARDEHAFVWQDFKDAVKSNWKQSLPISLITGAVPVVVYIAWQYYGNLMAQSALFIVPQAIVTMAAVVWFLALTYMYPITVGYEATFGQIVKNAMMIAIARLPHTVLARLITLIPTVIAVLVSLYTPYAIYAMMALGAYYLLIGNSFARFQYASFGNAAFDKLINVHIEGAQVNRGMSEEEDWDDEDEDETGSNGENA